MVVCAAGKPRVGKGFRSAQPSTDVARLLPRLGRRRGCLRWPPIPPPPDAAGPPSSSSPPSAPSYQGIGISSGRARTLDELPIRPFRAPTCPSRTRGVPCALGSTPAMGRTPAALAATVFVAVAVAAAAASPTSRSGGGRGGGKAVRLTAFKYVPCGYGYQPGFAMGYHDHIMTGAK